MTKVRRVVLKGKAIGSDITYHDKVECAVRADGTSPAEEFWLSLKEGAWPGEHAEYVPPESEVLHDYFKFMALLSHLMKMGYPKYRDASKHLVDGIWEVRHFTIRMPYFDVDENGVNRPKLPRTERQEIDPSRTDPMWVYPEMDQTLRLTHGFLKHGRSHPEEYELALQIRSEDLENG